MSPGNGGPADKQGSEEEITGSQSAQWRIQDKAMAGKRHASNSSSSPPRQPRRSLRQRAGVVPTAR